MHHPCLLLSVSVNAIEFENASTPVRYNFYRADYEGISPLLSGIHWDILLDKDDVNKATETFSHILCYAIDQHVI